MHRRAVLATCVLAACGEPSGESIASWQAAGTVCADGATTEGIDVSYWQGSIDWDSVAGAGIEYAFIRANHGLDWVDEYFASNWSEAKRVGIRRGAYQYYLPDEDPIEQAQLIVDVMGPLEPGDLPPVMDVENDGGQSPATIRNHIHLWMDHVERGTGRRPTIYTAKYFWQDNVGMPPDFLTHPLWVANYTDGCPLIADPWTRWDFWQYTSSGSVPGISGNVDRDEFNGDEAALDAFIAGTILCGNGECDAGERESCADDCVCEPIPPAGGTVEESSGCYVASGSITSWRSAPAGHGGTLDWTYAWDQPEENVGTWNLTMTEGGEYRVEVYTAADWSLSEQATYQIAHAGATDSVTIDQSALDGWQTLGDYSFAAGGDQSVRLGDSTGEASSLQRKLSFDAIRLTRLDAPSTPDAGPGAPDAGPGSPDAGPPGAEPGDGGCCSVAGRRGSPAGGLLVLLLLGVRAATARCSRGGRA